LGYGIGAAVKKKIQEALNDQINKELYSAYLYLSMSAYLEAQSLPGAAKWMKLQAEEEVEHAMKIFSFVNERDGRVLLAPIEGPKQEWTSPLEVFQQALKHEIFVTESINNIVTSASDEKDYATLNFLQWFVAEQVEEEANARENVEMFKRVENNPHGLFMVDRALAARE